MGPEKAHSCEGRREVASPANLVRMARPCDAFEANLGTIIFIKGPWGVNQLVAGPVCLFQVVL